MFKKKLKNIVNLPILEFEEKEVAFFVSKSSPKSKKILSSLNQVIETLGAQQIAKLIYYHSMRFTHAKMDSPLKIGNDIYSGTPIKIYTSVDAPPFDYLDENGNVAGVEIDILKYLAQSLQMPIEINICPFKSIFTNLENSKSDHAISGVGVSKIDEAERLEKFVFSKPFWSLKLSLICHDELCFNKTRDLSGLKIGVCEGEAGDIYINHCIEEDILSRNTKVFGYDNANLAFDAFAKGKIECMVVVNYVADGILDSIRGKR